MTNESKENLLKILTNAPNEQPGGTGDNFTTLGYKTPYLNLDFIQDYISYNNYNILLLTSGEIVLLDKDGNELLESKITINGVECSSEAIDIDENGQLYAFCYDTTSTPFRRYLAYLNNITQKVEGEYKIEIRITYELTSMIEEIDQVNLFARAYILLKKSPIDNRFLIVATGSTTSSSSTKNVTAIQYHVNVGSDNTYEYKQAKIVTNSSYIVTPITINVTWTDNNVTAKLLALNDNHEYSGVQAGSTNYILVNINLASSITSSTLLNLSNYFGYLVKRPLGQFLNSNVLFFATRTMNAEYKATFTLYKYTTSLTKVYEITGLNTGQNIYKGIVEVLKANNQVFACVHINNSNIEPYEWKDTFIHLLENNTYDYLVRESTTNMGGMTIYNVFDMYYININGMNCRYEYIENEYNGAEYFDNTSVTSRSMTLYSIDPLTGEAKPSFARKLYNKTLIGNEVNSITQVPYNYLNDTPIMSESLISKTNSVIDEDTKQIEKNMYEELYITNIDSFRVYDKNVGSTYNQNASLEVAKNVFNGFEDDYTITNYRVIKKDGTNKNYEIQEIERNGNVAEIGIYFYNDGVHYIELYDKNYKTLFVRLDVSNLATNKLYKIIEKVRVE